jgi:hypothetical protein
VRVQGQSVLVKVRVQLLGSEHLGDLNELVVVIAALKEGLSFENHASKHAAERPDVK